VIPFSLTLRLTFAFDSGDRGAMVLAPGFSLFR
jgi:hypothetical protein